MEVQLVNGIKVVIPNKKCYKYLEMGISNKHFVVNLSLG